MLTHLTDGLNVAHVPLHLNPESGGVGLGPDQHGDVAGEVSDGGAEGVCGTGEPVAHQTLVGRDPARLNCFFPHPHFEALLQSAVLALVAVVLVYRAVAVTAALVLKIPPHRPLEEALAA